VAAVASTVVRRVTGVSSVRSQDKEVGSVVVEEVEVDPVVDVVAMLVAVVGVVSASHSRTPATADMDRIADSLIRQ